MVVDQNETMIFAAVLPGQGGRISRWGTTLRSDFDIQIVLDGEELVELDAAPDPSRQWAFVDGQVVPYQPPAPPSTEWATYAWDAEAWAWVASPTEAAVAREVRAERDRRLAACDWVVARATERGEPVPPAWVAYREALRDVPEQPGFPTSVTWPAIPS